MRIGVTGAGGLLGTTLVPVLRQAGAEVIAWTRAGFDVADAEATRRAIVAARPELVVHAAAYTAVDRAESEPEAAMEVNRGGTANVCRACEEVGAMVVYLSTDYVFDGAARAPIPPDARPNPLGAYARSKAEGETVVEQTRVPWLVVRTGWAYGPGGSNFVDTMRQAAMDRRPVSVVDDQRGAPSSTRLISEGLRGLVSGGQANRVFHLAARGEATWYEVAREVYAAAGASADWVRPCTTVEAKRPAPRPRYSVLALDATERLLGQALPEWRPHLRHYVETGTLLGLGVVEGQ